MKKTNTTRLSLLLSSFGLSSVLLASIALSADATAGGVYRWVDDKGEVHYGDRAPDGVNSSAVKLKAGPSAGADDPIKQAEAVDKANTAAAEDTYKAEYDKKEKAVDQERCRVATENLGTLNTRPRIMVEENGQRRYLTPEEITAKKAEYQGIVDKECQP